MPSLDNGVMVLGIRQVLRLCENVGFMSFHSDSTSRKFLCGNGLCFLSLHQGCCFSKFSPRLVLWDESKLFFFYRGVEVFYKVFLQIPETV